MIPGRQTHCSRGWVVQLVAALVALLATILSSAPPSAVANAGTETRVRASASVVEVLVEPPQQEIAGHRLGNDAAGAGIVVATGVAAKGADDFVDLASASRRSHILDGEVRPNGSFGGGHRPGTGFPNKSEFPRGWSDDKIMHSISDIATDPSLIWRAGNKPGDFFVNGTRGGIDIEVLIRNNQIWTGYPTNVIRNAP